MSTLSDVPLNAAGQPVERATIDITLIGEGKTPISGRITDTGVIISKFQTHADKAINGARFTIDLPANADIEPANSAYLVDIQRGGEPAQEFVVVMPDDTQTYSIEDVESPIPGALPTGTETVQDIVGAFLQAGTGVTLDYDDNAGTLTITATGGGGGGATDPEIVRDTVAAFVAAGSGVSVAHDDALNTLTITAEVTQAELDAANAALTAHIDDVSAAHDATAVGFTPTALLASTDAQAAVEESILAQRPYLWFQHDAAQVIRNDVWETLAWHTVRNDEQGPHHQGLTAETTITAASDAQVLPQGTINVADTIGFESPAGAALIRIGGKDTIVYYTGLTATTLTGCTGGTGTLATGQTVRAANTKMIYPIASLTLSVVTVPFAPSVTGTRAVRFFQEGFDVARHGPVPGTSGMGGMRQSLQCAMQPASATPGIGYEIHVRQDSGGPLDVVVDGLNGPTMMQATLGKF